MTSRFRSLLAAALLAAAAAPASAQSGNTYYWRYTTSAAGNPSAWSSTFPGDTLATTAPANTNALVFTPYPVGAAGPLQPNIGAGLNAQSMTFGPAYDLNTPWTLTGNAGSLLTLGRSGATGVLAVQGPAAVVIDGVTLEGTSGPNGLNFNLGASASLTLAGTTTATFGLSNSSGSIAPFNLYGGTLTLDNTAVNITNRLDDFSFLILNNARINLVGNASAPTTETIAVNDSGSTSTLLVPSGQSTFNVLAAGGQTATLTLGSEFNRTNTLISRNPRAMIAFTNVDAAGNVVGTLGGGAGNPNVNVYFNNFIARTNGGGAAVAPYVTATTFADNGLQVGFATVNGRDFATVVNNTVVASTYVTAGGSTNTPGSFTQATAAAGVSLPDRVIAYAPTADLSTPNTIAGLGVKLTAVDAARTLAFTGSGSLATVALLATGPNNFTVDLTGTTGVFGVDTNTRFVTVEREGVVLEIRTSSLTGTSTAPLAKGGDGTLFLNGTSTNPTTGTTSSGILTVNAGVLRLGAGAGGYLGTGPGVSAAAPGAATSGSPIELRGGVLELAGGVDLQRTLGLTVNSGTLSWTSTSGPGERGSGGFAAIGGPSTVTVGAYNAPVGLTWGTTTNFIADGQALIFGSATADSRVDFRNAVGLDAGGGGLPYRVREVRVNDNPGSRADVARFSGVLSGTAATSLVKTGPGVLELTAANTYAGQTLVQAGTLRVGVPGVGGSIGAGLGVVVGTGGRLEGSGTVTAPVLARAGGVFAPGVIADALTPSTATLTAGSGVTVAAGATFAAQLNGAGSFSSLAFAGTLDVTGADLDVFTGPAFVPGGGGVYVVASNAGTTPVAGRFAGLGDGATGTTADGRFNFQISYFATPSGTLTGGNSIALYNFTAAVVPEPLTALAAGAAGLGLVGWVRRRRTA